MSKLEDLPKSRLVTCIKRALKNRYLRILPVPPTQKDIKDLLRIYIHQSSDKPVVYRSSGYFHQPLMLLHILEMNHNDCHIKRSSDLAKMDYQLFATKETRRYPSADGYVYVKDPILIPLAKKEIILAEYESCKRKGKMLVIPMTIRYGGGLHSNMLIINFHRNELERFEPHGKKTGGVDAGISYSIDIECFKLAKYMRLRYISSENIFSQAHLGKGFQAFDTAPLEEHIRDDYVIKDPRGFCTAWSFFYADIRLKYPQYSAIVLTDQIYSGIGKNPGMLRKFIRGQMKFLEKEVNKINGFCSYTYFINLDTKSEEYKDTKKLYQTYINKRFSELAK